MSQFYLILAKFFFFRKNEFIMSNMLFYSTFMQKIHKTVKRFKDIAVREIEQSEWPRAFRAVTQELEFSQICSFHRMIESHNNFNFITIYPNMVRFLSKLKITNFWAILAPFCPSLGKQEFSQKIGLCHFCIFMYS